MEYPHQHIYGMKYGFYMDYKPLIYIHLPSATSIINVDYKPLKPIEYMDSIWIIEYISH